MDQYPYRKRTRLADYDYSTPGSYFVTICTAQRRPILSKIVVGQGLAPAVVQLLPCGEIVKSQLDNLSDHFANIRVDAVRTLKSLTVRMCHRRCICSDQPIFQVSFYDHIIRNQTDYDAIWTYIDNNPAKWGSDRFCIN